MNSYCYKFLLAALGFSGLCAEEVKAKKKHDVVFDLELSSGYRQDDLYFYLYSATGRPTLDEQDSTAYIWQSNLKVNATILNHGYINFMGGYGLLVNNNAAYSTDWITANLVTTHQNSTHSGYAADWEIQGGGYFNVYKHYIRLAPELGYSYKRVKAKNAYAETFKAPYVGARADFMVSEKHKVHILGFYDYYYCISRSDLNYAYLQYGDMHISNQLITNGSSNAYKTGAMLTYMPFKHWTFGLKWQMFHLRTKPVTVSVSSGIYSGTEKMKWTSQEAQFSVDYKF